MKKTVKYSVRIMLGFLAGLVSLLLLVAIAIQTPPAKRQILRIAEQQANAALNAELSIGELSGNFFGNLRLTNILLKTKEEDTLAYISSLSAEYKLLPLLQGNSIINDISIENPYLYLEELADSTWNIAHILKLNEESPDTASTEFSMKITLHRFLLTNGAIRIKASDEIIPRQIHDLNVNLAGEYAEKKQKLEVGEFRFIAEKPDFELKNFGLTLAADTSSVQLSNMLLQTKLNELTADALYYFSGGKESKATLQTAPIDISEFRPFLPETFDIKLQPAIYVNALLKNKRLTLDASLASGKQGLDISLLSDYSIEYFTGS
ncbi:MAG: AsmA family protein, partial [Prevotellaceae bacterium]|nr:AsmA family protein [Prevotellaceae bacterium]